MKKTKYLQDGNILNSDGGGINTQLQIINLEPQQHNRHCHWHKKGKEQQTVRKEPGAGQGSLSL